MKWTPCTCCHRLYVEDSLEFEFCKECIHLLGGTMQDYDRICLMQRLKYGDFQDKELAECVKMIWNIFNQG